MKVRATKLGYYDHRRRREGDVFEIHSEKAFSKLWMEKVGAPAQAPAKGSKKPIKPAVDEVGDSSVEVL